MPRRRDPDLTAEEKHLWDEVKKTTKPIRKKKSLPAEPALPPKPSAKIIARPAVERASPKQARLTPARQMPDGAWSGIDHRTSKRFTQGQLDIDATLDLHGMTQARAFEHFVRFVEQAYAMQKRMLLVITGKGARSGGVSVLRTALPCWVNTAPLSHYVLALHPAQRQHGGEGAYYLLLRRQRANLT